MTTITIIRFDDVSNWLACVESSYAAAQRSMWEFLLVLRAGVDQFGRTDHAKAELYEAAAVAIGRSAKTIQNYVSASRKPTTELAIELGLELGHAVAVLGLDNERAEGVLLEAAENGLSVEATRYIAHRPIPDIGKSEFDPDNDPPTANREFYDQRIRCPHCGGMIEV